MDVILNAQRDVNDKFGPEFKPLEKETIYKRSYTVSYTHLTLPTNREV